jgi:hypothetical protein
MTRLGDVSEMKRLVRQVEPMLDMMPADRQLPMKYVMQR